MLVREVVPLLCGTGRTFAQVAQSSGSQDPPQAPSPDWRPRRPSPPVLLPLAWLTTRQSRSQRLKVRTVGLESLPCPYGAEAPLKLVIVAIFEERALIVTRPRRSLR